jgi:hypothetical protein
MMLQNWNRRLKSPDYYNIEVAQTFETPSYDTSSARGVELTQLDLTGTPDTLESK